MAVHKANTAATKPRRRIRSDTHTVEYYPYIVSGKSSLDKWMEKPKRAILSKYQIHCHNGGGNRVRTPYSVVNGRPSYGIRTYMAIDTTRRRWRHQLRFHIPTTLPQSPPRHTRRRQ
eukprot:5172819-Pyramimonas_sp.AAC.1